MVAGVQGGAVQAGPWEGELGKVAQKWDGRLCGS